MNHLDKRVAALEAQTPTDDGQWHRIIQQPGQTQNQAINAYGRERIAEGDRVIMRQVIDVAGRNGPHRDVAE